MPGKRERERNLNVSEIIHHIELKYIYISTAFVFVCILCGKCSRSSDSDEQMGERESR